MKEGFEKELEIVCNKASSLGLQIILDISKPMYQKLKLPKIYALRLDYGFSLDEIVDLYNKNEFVIELNASTITEQNVNYLQSRGIVLQNIRISHNFYPKKYTGLSREEVINKNRFYKELGMKVAMYIPSSNQKRPPMYEGLPTIEEHRYLPLEVILSEIKSLGINEVIFSDAYCSKEEIELAKNFDYDMFLIPIKLKTKISENERELLERVHINRIDTTPYFVRSSCRNLGEILPNNTIERKVGFVTIDNSGFKRYQGEVCIMLKDALKDERVNVVGEVLCSLETLKLIKGNKKFKFKILE